VHPTWQRHRLLNRVQTAILILVLIGIFTLAGSVLFGGLGLWVALGASLGALLIEPAAASGLVLRLYRARPIGAAEAPEIWAVLHELAARADLPSVPRPYYVPSVLVNAFATGSRKRSAIALNDGLLRTLTPRELAGVLAHEVAHIANGDLRVMGLADYVSRLTGMLALAGQFALIAAVPLHLAGAVAVNWLGLLLLVLSPHAALLAQLGLSRIREFDADATAAGLTADPRGLASALAKIERASRSWRTWILPGWGNPEPSWLRTHPTTQERIQRLLELTPDEGNALRRHAPAQFVIGLPAIHRPPRWHLGGYWR
jgi:heat shock protein HtpX